MNTNRTRLSAAIVGLSWIGADPAGEPSDPVLGTAVPYSHASAYAACPQIATLVGCDPDEAARKSFVATWSDRYPGVRAYADLDELLQHERPDIVSVVTPDHLHVPVALAALEAGVRMIFCEKPLSIDVAEADHLIAVADDLGATISVNYTRHWVPETVEARAQLRAGTIGDLSQVILQLGGPRAMLFRNLTHSLDTMAYFADSDPAWVFSDLESGFEEYGTSYQGDGRDPDKEPGANVYVRFANGVRGYLAGQKSMVAGDSVQLVGSRGRIVIDSEGLRIQALTDAGLMTRRPAPQFTTAGMAAAVADLIASHLEHRPTASPPEHARRAVAMTTAVLQSQAQHNVRVPITPTSMES